MLWIGGILGCCIALGVKPLKRDITLSLMVRITEALRDALGPIPFKTHQPKRLYTRFIPKKGRFLIVYLSYIPFAIIRLSYLITNSPKSDAWIPKSETCPSHTGQRSSVFYVSRIIATTWGLRKRLPNSNKNPRRDISAKTREK